MDQQEPNELFFHYRPAFFAKFGPEQDEIQISTSHPAETNYACPGLPLTTIKIGNAPSAVCWNKVSVDDHSNSPHFGFTTIGPMFPHAYGAAGVYLVDAKSLESPCDLTAFVQRRAKGERWRRYHGFVGFRLGNPSSKLWIVYHPGTGTPGKPATQRAPRATHVPEASSLIPVQKEESIYLERLESPQKDIPQMDTLKPVKVPSGIEMDVNKTIYLERNFAIYTAELDVPKRPSGSGAFIQAMDMTDVISEPNPERENFSVMSRELTGELGQIAKSLGCRYWAIESHETLADGLVRYHEGWVNRAHPPRFRRLDIIGHSRAGDMMLKLGELALTPRVIDRELRRLYVLGILQDLGIEEVRLLGCRTGAHPRARQVVEAITRYVPTAYTTRADLFGVHFDDKGLKESSNVLLASGEVVSYSRPGDVPPEDDYPVVPYDEPDETAPPQSFDIATLSKPNSAAVSAKGYLLWDSFTTHFGDLRSHLISDLPIRDNVLIRASFEVLVKVAVNPQSIDDYRSFDVIDDVDDHALPRVRVCANGAAHSFLFKKKTDIRGQLAKLQIHLGIAKDVMTQKVMRTESRL